MATQFARKTEEILDLLGRAYGRPRFIPRFEPMEELISCILSQHTADRNSFPTFTHLMETFGTWDAIAHAPQEELAQVIRKAGLANQKAKSIQGTLRQIPNYDLTFLRDMPVEDALEWLEKLPGVGPKTASIVLCFSLGRPAIPVDTHVFRVGQRLGLIPKTLDEKKAHPYLRKKVPAHLCYDFHALLIQHGRKVCRAPKPDCANCSIQRLCPTFSKLQLSKS